MRAERFNVKGMKRYISAGVKGNQIKNPVTNYYTMNKDDPNYWGNYKKTHIFIMNQGREWVVRNVVAGNGTGKTLMCCAEHVYHLRGEYPIWWQGAVYDPFAPDSNYQNVITLLVTQEISTFKDVILPLLLGPDFVANGMNPKYAGGGMIRREWLATRDDGTPRIDTEGNGDSKVVRRIYVKHKSPSTGKITTSQLILKSVSQGSDSIVSIKANFLTGDEKINEHLRDEMIARCLPRFVSGRGMFTNTEDENYASMTITQRERMDKGQEIVDVNPDTKEEIDIEDEKQPIKEGFKRVHAWRFYQFSDSDIPHISVVQQTAFKKNLSSEDAYHVRGKGTAGMDANRVITADWDDVLYKENGEVVDFSDEDKRWAFCMGLERRKFAQFYAIDTGSKSWGILSLYVKAVMDGFRRYTEKIYIVDAYNFHQRSAREKRPEIAVHLEVLKKMVGRNGRIIHKGICDGYQKVDPTNYDRRNMEQWMNDYLEVGQEKNKMLHNSFKHSEANLEERIANVNELFTTGRMEILYSKMDSGMKDTRRGTFAMKDQMTHWVWQVGQNPDGTNYRKIAQRGADFHLVKDCLTSATFGKNIYRFYRDNLGVKYTTEHNRFKVWHKGMVGAFGTAKYN